MLDWGEQVDGMPSTCSGVSGLEFKSCAASV